MNTDYVRGRRPAVLALVLGALAALALVAASSTGVAAQSGDKGKSVTPPAPEQTESNQIVTSFPLTITFLDTTQMDIRYRNPNERQFYGYTAEGVYLWVKVGGVVKVFGPGTVPAGNPVNPYTPISNAKTGSGAPSDPFIVTTVVGVPGTSLRLTQRGSYVNGAEFVSLKFELSQVVTSEPSKSQLSQGATVPVTATLFHAADLYTAGSDSGYGYYDASTGGVGDYFTRTNGIVQYQQFVPDSSTPANAYQESYYDTIWGSIGSTSGPGPGFNNTIVPSSIDSGAGLQWNLTVPASGSVTVGDTDLFSPHASLCGAFSDVPQGSFAYQFIYYLACQHIVSGYQDTTFRPDNPVSRGQLSKIVSNSAGFANAVTVQTFEDVPPGSPFYVWVQRLAGRGFISGYPCGTVAAEPCVAPTNRQYFRPNNSASRGQISKIISNAKMYNDPASGQIFQDVPPGSPFYVWVQRLATRGVMNGYTCNTFPTDPCVAPNNRPYFHPNSPATRAQTAKIDANTFFPTCCP